MVSARLEPTNIPNYTLPNYTYEVPSPTDYSKIPTDEIIQKKRLAGIGVYV